jgi:hypothetical protein
MGGVLSARQHLITRIVVICGHMFEPNTEDPRPGSGSRVLGLASQILGLASRQLVSENRTRESVDPPLALEDPMRE